MKVHLVLLLPMLSDALGQSQLELSFEGQTVGDLLNHLTRNHGPRAARALLDADGQLDREVQLLVNKQTWVTRDNLDTPLSEGDEVRILVMMAGG